MRPSNASSAQMGKSGSIAEVSVMFFELARDRARTSASDASSSR